MIKQNSEKKLFRAPTGAWKNDILALGLKFNKFWHMSTHVIWSESCNDHVSLQYDDTAVTHIMWFCQQL